MIGGENVKKEVKHHKKDLKSKLFQVRLTEEDADLFEAISNETDDSKSEVFRKALRLYATIKRNNMYNSFLG